MRHILATLLVLTGAAAAAAQSAEERFPYSAFVNVGEAAVRSGPGETFYPVLALRHGDAVEVWRHDPAGWCAIRPPEGAFSWISADFVRRTGESTGVVVGSQVNVRVGTVVSDLRDAVQVKLDDGEAVDILEARALVTGDRETLWYKILPPSGEFRWIHQSQLVNHPDLLRRPAAADVAQPNLGPSGDVRPVSYDEPLPRGGQDFTARLRSLPADAAPPTVLDELELALSQMVVAEPTAWSFAEFTHRADAILENAESAGDRSRARMFLSKLERFEDIQKRYTSIAHLRTQTTEVEHGLAAGATDDSARRDERGASARPPVPSIAERAALDPTRYDGVGRLMQIADGKSAPSYALTNDAGDVQMLVAPAPGVNLRQFLGLDVGINGIRGYAADKGRDQLTAKRIDVLESRLRR